MKAGRDSGRENPGSRVVATTLPLPVINSCYRGDAKISHASRPQNCPHSFFLCVIFLTVRRTRIRGAREEGEGEEGREAKTTLRQQLLEVEHLDTVHTPGLNISSFTGNTENGCQIQVIEKETHTVTNM